jgi:FdhE protein
VTTIGSPISAVAVAPFARLPDPDTLFCSRAERCRALAAMGGELAPYLSFLRALAEIQHRSQDGLSAPQDPAPTLGVLPLDRRRYRPDAGFATILDGLLGALAAAPMPAAAQAALARLQAAAEGARQEMVANLLEDAVPVDAFAEHALVAAALQVEFVRRAARLDATRLQPAGNGICPCCGGPPVGSLVVGWPAAAGSRYCACALCATLWNYVRIKCTLCGSTAGIAYHAIDGDAGTVKAETCDSCRNYVKILHQQQDPELDPIVDDVASLGLDLLLREAGYRRGAFNPFLLGY